MTLVKSHIIVISKFTHVLYIYYDYIGYYLVYGLNIW